MAPGAPRDSGIVRAKMQLLDALVFSGVWVAVAAGALCLAAGRAMGAAPDAWAVGLASAGTLLVYGVDRLRDLERDRATAPRRSAFVTRHRDGLQGLALLAGMLAGVCALQVGPAAALLVAPVAAAGLLHRRLKGLVWWKPLYVSAAWTVVVVGLPAVVAPSPRHVGPVAAVLFLALFANAIASNLRDGEAVTARFGPGVPLGLSRGLAAVSLLVAALAPAPVRPLLGVPAALLAALAPFRPEERYGLVVVDGALWMGALASLPFA